MRKSPSTVVRPNIFTWLDIVRKRPEVFGLHRGLHELETLTWGYVSALSHHGIVEDVPHMGLDFLFWLLYRKRWGTAGGWAVAIEERFQGEAERLAVFFELIDEYRTLVPTVVWTVRLGPGNRPTGKRIRRNGLVKRPSRIDVVRYHPEPLHFLRFHYGRRVEDHSLLSTGRLDFATTAPYAKRWVEAEFQVDPKSWERVSARKARARKA